MSNAGTFLIIPHDAVGSFSFDVNIYVHRVEQLAGFLGIAVSEDLDRAFKAGLEGRPAGEAGPG